ncbi:transposase [Candidatus Frankia nodulisporulans]|uniref:transposase n=1 Tax=Candidatus Frankia nodulisporulans TaxID=2060052 RepID=UPI0013D2A4AF|nr:transposase [Candidatus Frankia nodulisporulans]
MGRPTRYTPAFRAQAVAQVRQTRPRHTSEWAAIQAVAATFAISTETLRTWVRGAESTAERTRADLRRHQAEIRRLARENTELRRALDLLRATATSPTGNRAAQGDRGTRISTVRDHAVRLL